MAAFASDLFTDTTGTALASHTPTSGGSWSAWSAATDFASSSMLITDANRVRTGTAGSNGYFHSATPPSANYTVSVDIYFASILGSTVFAGVLGRCTGTSTETSYVAFINGQTGQISLGYWNFTFFTDSGLNYTPSISAGQTHTLAMRLTATQVIVSWDGSDVMTWTNADITSAGKAGLFLSNATTNSTGPHIDNFQAGDLVAATKGPVALRARTAIPRAALR